MENFQGVEITHFSMSRGNPCGRVVWDGKGSNIRRKESRKELAKIFLKEKVLNLIFFIAISVN